MNPLKYISVAVVCICALYGFTGCGSSSYTSDDEVYSTPAWAPAYTSGVRYYYFPDIEVYYDLTSEDFIYLDDGYWRFSHFMPPMYSNYDLYNGFVVSLNYNAYEPWRHHQYYLSHYPRYYYRNRYHESERNNIRGFNENGQRPYHRKEVRPKLNPVPAPAPAPKLNPAPPEKNVEFPKFSRDPQAPNYYGREIGRPVRVTPSMKEKREEKNRKDAIEYNKKKKELSPR